MDRSRRILKTVGLILAPLMLQLAAGNARQR